MQNTKDTISIINNLIEKFLHTSNTDPNNLKDVVCKINALPVVFDMGGVYCIKPDGKIISAIWDDTESWREETDPRICNIAVFQGSKKYPELCELVPERPEDAITCSYCNGSGVEPMAIQLNTDNIVCYCGGLGWIPNQHENSKMGK